LQLPKHGAHLARGELVLILLHGEGHDHVLDESNLRLSRFHLTACCAEAHRDHSYVHLCDNELRRLCAVLQSGELLDDHHRGTNDRYLDDRDLLEDDPLNHHDHTTDDHRDHRDLLTDDHYLGDRDLLEDDPLNHHGYKTDGHRDRRDLLMDGRDLGHHFVHTQDDLLDDYLDGPDARHDPLMDDRYLVDPDCPKDGHYLDDHGLRLVCLNDRLHRRDGLDAMVCRILLPVADDVDRDFLGLALDEVYLQTTPKRRTYAICD
jgi:hypothetical protein